MKQKFVWNLFLIVILNLLIKPFYIIGIDAEVINMHTLKPIDKELIFSTAKKTKKIITLEEHNIIGGLGSAVAETISEYNFNVKQKIFGINDKFNYGVGSQEYHLEKNGLSVENLLIKVKNFLKDKDV